MPDQPDPKVVEVEGEITTADGQKRKFLITAGLGWQQWGNTTTHLGHTVEALEAMTNTLIENDLIGDRNDD